MAQRIDVLSNLAHVGAVQHGVAAKGRHLRHAGLVVTGIDAYAHSFRDGLWAAVSPQPIAIGQVWIAAAAGAVEPMAGSAVVAKQLSPALRHMGHKSLVRLDLIEGERGNLRGPRFAGRLVTHDDLFHRVSLVDPQNAFGIGPAQWEGRHQHPPHQGEQMRDYDEPEDAARNRRIQLLDAVPLVPGGLLPADRVYLDLAHGRSSSRNTDVLAASNFFRFLGQKV